MDNENSQALMLLPLHGLSNNSSRYILEETIEEGRSRNDVQQHTPSQPLHLLCVAASSDTDSALLAQWERHLRPLQQAGQVTIWSKQHLLAGKDRKEELAMHLEQAQCVVFLLSSDFFDDELCLSLMHEALLRHRQQSLRLVPLLVRPVAWQASPLGTFAPLPATGNAITTWESPDEGWQQAVTGLQRLFGLPLQRHPASTAARVGMNREHMLRRLRLRYEQMRMQSLQGAVQMELGLVARPAAIHNASNLLLRLPDQPDQPLPPHSSIVDAYEQAQHELLILGEPGAGKSTLLVELAHHLLEQAEQDATSPLPIVLPLSTWANRCPPLQEWFIEQLTLLYDIPRKFSRQLIEAEQVLPLLDGLDEMNDGARPACVAAINAYHRNHLHPLVVCSRTVEYERATTRERLTLHTAVVVQPLSREHVLTSLAALGKSLAALCTALKNNPTLATLATTPLMLQILILTYRETTVRQLAQQETVLQQQIWTAYVERMIARKGDSQRYPRDHVVVWLSWLARIMRDRNQTIFTLERLQLDVLPHPYIIFYRWSGALLVGLTVGLAFGLVVGLTVGLAFGLVGGLVGGLLFGLAFGRADTIEPTERVSISWEYLKDGLEWGGPAGLVIALVVAFFRLFYRPERKQFIHREMLSPNEGMRRSLTYGLSISLSMGLLYGLGSRLVFGQLFGLVGGLLVGLSGGQRFGLCAVLQHYLLRFWLAYLDHFPLKAVPFLDDATARVLLRRVGGGYSFTHRLLLEYFAHLDTATPSPSTDDPSLPQSPAPEAS